MDNFVTKIPHRQTTKYLDYKEKFISVNNEFSTSLVREPDEALPRDHVQQILNSVIHQLHKNDLQAALRASEQACKKNAGSSLCLIEYARQLLATGNLDNANSVLEIVLKNNQHNVEALKLYGYLQIQFGNISSALEHLTNALKRSPSDSFTQINLNALRYRIKPTKNSSEASFSRATIATSLPPRDIETSRLATNSWLKLGFKVISVNTTNERDILAPHFPEIEFCINEDTAREECAGKDYQYLDSLLDALVAHGEGICGIINADIVLRGEQSSWNSVLHFAKDHFVFGSRINVNDLSQRYGMLLEPGFDFFFFPRDFPSSVPRTGFVFGQPAWDLFFPSWATITNTPCAFCYSPSALHVTHPMNWSPTANSRYIAMALKWLAPNFADMIINYPGASVEYLRILTAAITKILNRSAKGNAKPLFLGGKDHERLFAPVDPYYWAHSSDETLVVF